MQNKFTKNDLIRFIYGETTPDENSSIRNELRSNWSLKEEFLELKKMNGLLHEGWKKPSDTSVNLILQYSREMNQEKVSV